MPKQSDDDRGLEWIHIDDFTPGCFDNSFISLAEPKLSAPLGSADAISTWCCASLAAGLGLAPLPALTASETAVPLPGGCTSAFLTGFAVNPGLDSAVDELIIIFECDNGTTHYNYVYSDIPMGPSLTALLTDSGTTQPGIFGSPYPTWTRMNAGGTGNPPPKLVFPASILDASAPNGHLYVYPPVSNPALPNLQDLIVGGSSITGQVICYGSRVIVLAGINYTWPFGGGINTNENINFTDPPESSTYGNQMDVLAAEAPWGYGAWGTISVGELMLIKKNGGGLIIYGDIDAITSAVPMPGVQSTGDFVGKAAATPLGLVYCSEQRGAWVWNGSMDAQKISQQLRDGFYDATTPTGMQGNNYGFDVAHWQNWILFSNNYMYNLDTGSWWQFYPGDGNGSGSVTGHTMWWWYESRFGNQMYAAPLKFGTVGGLADNWWYKFDSEVPAPHYQWTSLPIHVDARADRRLDVRQLILRLSDPSASGAATVTATIGSWSETTTRTITNEPQEFRFNVGTGALGIQDIVIKINADNAGHSAPILHSIDLGYQVRAGQAVEV